MYKILTRINQNHSSLGKNLTRRKTRKKLEKKLTRKKTFFLKYSFVKAELLKEVNSRPIVK